MKARRLKFFSGFGFKGEEELFADFLPSVSAPFCVAGFSMGAINAFECAIAAKNRIEKLILLSPAFFQNKEEKFRKLQLISFAKSRENYMRNFYSNCGKFDEKFCDLDPQKNNLEFLLNYRWDRERFSHIKNTAIEIYLGGKDRVIDSAEAFRFFELIGAKIIMIKNANHLLQIEGE